jgi:hypothetical protein
LRGGYVTALKDIRVYMEANEATLETIQASVDALDQKVERGHNEVAGLFAEVHRFLGEISDKQDLINSRLQVLQDQVVEGFRRMNDRVVYVEEKQRLSAVKGGKK